MRGSNRDITVEILAKNMWHSMPPKSALSCKVTNIYIIFFIPRSKRFSHFERDPFLAVWISNYVGGLDGIAASLGGMIHWLGWLTNVHVSSISETQCNKSWIYKYVPDSWRTSSIIKRTWLVMSRDPKIMGHKSAKLFFPSLKVYHDATFPHASITWSYSWLMCLVITCN